MVSEEDKEKSKSVPVVCHDFQEIEYVVSHLQVLIAYDMNNILLAVHQYINFVAQNISVNEQPPLHIGAISDGVEKLVTVCRKMSVDVNALRKLIQNEKVACRQCARNTGP